MATAGGLDYYRRKSTFDVSRMQDVIIGEDALSFMHMIWNTLEKDPLFNPQVTDYSSLDEEREITHKRVKRLMEYDFLPLDESLVHPAHNFYFNIAVSMVDLNTLITYSLTCSVMNNIMR
jgi:hypothetical protein